MPVVGSQSHGELERSLTEGMIQDEAERLADQDHLGEDGLDDVDPDPDDLDDETLDLALSAIEDIDARLAKLKDQAAQR